MSYESSTSHYSIYDETAYHKKDMKPPSRTLPVFGIRPFSRKSRYMKWVVLIVVAIVLLYWRSSLVSKRMRKEKDDALEAGLEDLEDLISGQREDTTQALQKAKYWEGVASGLTKANEGMSRRIFSQEKNAHIRNSNYRAEREEEGGEEEALKNENESKKEKVVESSVEQVLNMVEKTVKSSIKSTLDTLQDALDIKHIHVSQDDKDETAAKLIEVAVALEIAAEKLNLEAHEISGDKKANEYIEDEILKAIITDDTLTPDMVEKIAPGLNDELKNINIGNSIENDDKLRETKIQTLSSSSNMDAQVTMI